MVVVSTIYSFVGEHSVWKGLVWECLFMGLLNFKVCFQLVVYLCDQDVFFVALCNSTQVPILFEVLFRIWPIHGSRYRSALEEGYLHEDFDVLLRLLVIQSNMRKHKKRCVEIKNVSIIDSKHWDAFSYGANIL